MTESFTADGETFEAEKGWRAGEDENENWSLVVTLACSAGRLEQ